MNDMANRILLFSHDFPPQLSGAGTVCAQLAQFLIARGYEVHLMVRAQPGRQQIDGATFHDVAVVPKLWFRSYRRALAAIDLDQFDRIILTEAAPAIVAGKYFDEATLARCIVMMQGVEVERLYPVTLANLPRRLFGFTAAYKRATARCHAVVAVSKAMREKFVAASGQADMAPMEVVYAGVDNRVFKRQPSNYRRERNIPETDFVLVTSSRLVWEKGLEEMLEAFGELCRTRVNARWVICGDGPLLPMLRRRAEAMGLDERIIFEGACSQDALCRIYNDCDVFWLISHHRYREAFGLVYVEAQLCGLPTAGRDSDGVKEAIVPGSTGWLVNDAAECVALLHCYAEERGFDPDEVALSAQPFVMETTLARLLPLLGVEKGETRCR